MQTKIFKVKVSYSFLIFCLLVFYSLPSQSQATLKCNSIEECKKLFEESANSFLGSSYSYGSMGKGGFDCSGLVLTMANKLINQVTLPRRSQDMYSMLTNSVSLHEAKMGDLLFFNTGRGVSHVGLYWGKDNKGRNIMYHASSSKGVEMRVLDGNKYWMSRLVGIKRFAPLTNAVSTLGNEKEIEENTKQKQEENVAEDNSKDKKIKVTQKILGIIKGSKESNKAQDEQPKEKEETKVSIIPTSDTQVTVISSNQIDLRAQDEKPSGFYITAEYKEEIEYTSKEEYLYNEYEEDEYEVSYSYEY